MGTLTTGIKEIFSSAKTTGSNVMLCGNDGTPDGHINMANLASVLCASGLRSQYIDVSIANHTVNQHDSGGYYSVKEIVSLPSGALAYSIFSCTRYVGGVSLSLVVSDTRQYILFASSEPFTFPNDEAYKVRIYYY